MSDTTQPGQLPNKAVQTPNVRASGTAADNAPADGNLHHLMAPSRVAIIGASDNPARIGGRPISYCLRAGYQGTIYPVNPHRKTVQGLVAYGSVYDLPDRPDLAVIAIPAEQAVTVVNDCANLSIPACMMLTSGFAEIGARGARLQRKLSDIAKKSGIRILGPNCLGLVNAEIGFLCAFSSIFLAKHPTPGPFAIASQSGAVGIHLFQTAHQRGLPIGFWASTGNECDIQTADIISWYAARDDVHTILAYLESAPDGNRLMRALAAAQLARKPVVIIKVGRSKIGAKAARSHTAALAGEDAVYDEVFREFGAIRAETPEHLVDIAYAAGHRTFPRTRKTGIVTISGGVGVLFADAAAEQGLILPALGKSAQHRLRKEVPFVGSRNPIDMTAQVINQPEFAGQCLSELLSSGQLDSIVVYLLTALSDLTFSTLLREECTRVLHELGEGVLPIVCAHFDSEMRRCFERDGWLTFDDPVRATKAIAAMCRFGESLRSPAAVLYRRHGNVRPVILDRALAFDGVISEHPAKHFLAQHAIPVVPERLVTSEAEALQAADEFAVPVAMKIAAPGLVHKSDIGGVALRVTGADEITERFRALQAAARDFLREPSQGVLVSPMIDGIEMILGARYDENFGPVITLGLGGIYTEILADRVLRLAPVQRGVARAMIRDLRGYGVLSGVRKQGMVDEGAIEKTIVNFSRLVWRLGRQFETIEINPLMVHSQGVVAVDALITL